MHNSASDDSIIFLGSGPVAAQSLELLAKQFVIEAVITKPQPSHHRGKFPVIEISEKLGIPIHTVGETADIITVTRKKLFKSRLGVLIDFGIILSQEVIDAFPLGIINSHFSILPEWRGADPISFAILSGQKHTGVSLMQIVEKMDEGPILAFGVHDLVGDETTPELTSRLIVLSDALLRDTLPQYMKGEKKPIPQEIIVELVKQHVEPLELSESYSRKLTKQDGILDFTKPAVQLEREIRAFTDWPKSRTTIAGKDVIITQSHVAQKEIQLPPGLPGHTYVTHEGILGIVTSKDTLLIDKLKPSGKSAMTAQAFLAGYGRNL